jgi:methylated-DNA-[protein]-cysteine S-methyltransferase
MATAQTTTNFALFDTAIGRCGISWGKAGVTALQLPERNDSETQAKLLRKSPEAQSQKPPQKVQQAIDEISALLRGEKRDLSGIPLDMAGVPDFHRRCYDFARTIPPGRTLSYGEIAAKVGKSGAARAVGQAMGRNPLPLIIPCHRVLAAGGKLGGFSAPGGAATKRRMLELEGVGLAPEPPMQQALF